MSRASPCRSSARAATYDFGPSARTPRRRCAEAVLERGLPPRTFLNINVPTGEPQGIQVTVQAQAQPRHRRVDERTDPRGQAVLLDRRRGEQLGAARPVGLSGGEATATSRSRRCSPISPRYDALALCRRS